VTRLPRYSRRRWVWRSVLAAPFAVTLLLALALGPGTIDDAHVSFAWLLISSLVAGTLLIVAADGLLAIVGLITFLAFPLLAGPGFTFAPAWAQPVVALVFYGSIVASLLATEPGASSSTRARRSTARPTIAARGGPPTGRSSSSIPTAQAGSGVKTSGGFV
jgi:hypothetical protein